MPPTERLPLPGPRLIVPFVAVIEAVPAKFGADIVPLPESAAEFVVIVYVPAGRAWPLRVRAPAGTVNVIETLPVTVAV